MSSEKLIEEAFDATFSRPVGTVFPTFFIGVGGCGSGIVKGIRDHLVARPDFEERYKNLVHFMLFDTDKDDLAEMKGAAETFLISDFPKGEYVRLASGREYKEKDPFFTQWWPDWYASRPDSTKGAGQIRVESRLSMYYQLDNDRAGIIKRINTAIELAKDHKNVFRAVRPPAAYVHIFGSCAGGTGSGGMLTLGYLMQEQLKKARLSPVVVANVVLPTLFYRKVRHRLHDDIKSNGYAFMKEVEWFMTLGYNNNPRMRRGDIDRADEDRIPFNYNPSSKPAEGDNYVTRSPFDLVNVIDQPGDFAFESPADIYPAISAAAYVQLFSAIMGQRESEEDNYYKKIKHLDGGFSQNYGTFGLSVLELPDQAIAKFCEHKLAEVFAEALKRGSDGNEFDRVKKLAAAAVRENINEEDSVLRDDPRLEAYVHAGLLAELANTGDDKAEHTRKRLGEIFGDKMTKGGALGLINALKSELVKKMRSRFASLDAKQVGSAVSKGIKEPWAPGTEQREWDALEERFVGEFDGLRVAIQNAVEQEIKQSVASLEAQFTEQNLNPFGVQLAIQNFTRGESGKAELSIDVPQAPLVERLTHLAKKTGMEKVTGEKDWEEGDEDKGYKSAKGEVRDHFAKNFDAGLEAMDAWLQAFVHNQIREALTQKGADDSKLVELVKGLPAKFAREAQSYEDGSKMTGQNYVLSSEVLRGTRSGNRHWSRLFDYLIEDPGKRTNTPIHGSLNAFAKIDTTGRAEANIMQLVKLRDLCARAVNRVMGRIEQGEKLNEKVECEKALVEAITRFCREIVIQKIVGERQAGSDRGQKGLLLDEALLLEAKWELENLYADDHLVNFGDVYDDEDKARRRKKLAAQADPTNDNMENYIKEKLSHCVEKSRVLARLRLTESSAVDPFIFIAMAQDYKPANGAAPCPSQPLQRLVQEAHDMLREARLLDNWVDEKRIVFYQGQAGLPIHNFWPINGELKESYERVYRDYVTGHDPKLPPKKDFPSHIDTNFEDPTKWDPHAVLPSLEPGRSLKKLAQSNRLFYECLVHGFVHRVDVNPTSDVNAEIDAVLAGFQALPGVGALDPSKQHIINRFRKQVRSAIRARVETPEQAYWWILNLPEDAADVDSDDFDAMILLEGLPQEIQVLGDQLDRAVEYFDGELIRGGQKSDRALTERLSGCLDAKKAEEAEKLDPNPFAAHVLKHVEFVRNYRDQMKLELEDGKRVRGLYEALVEAVELVRKIYEDFKDSTDN